MNAPEGITVTVRAMPAPGHVYRRRAGRAWSKDAVAVKVVDVATAPDEITPSQLIELQSDRHLAVSTVGGDSADAAELNAVKVQLQAATAAAIEARKEYGDLGERHDKLRLLTDRDGEAQRIRIGELEAEVSALRDRLKAPKRG